MDQHNDLQIETIKKGEGQKAALGDSVSVEYTGTLTDGTVFDSNEGSGAPFTFMLGKGQVIKGWEMGVRDMQIGETRKLTIPHELAYGEEGYPGAIPPKATLVFTVTLKAVN